MVLVTKWSHLERSNFSIMGIYYILIVCYWPSYSLKNRLVKKIITFAFTTQKVKAAGLESYFARLQVRNRRHR
jgi:hypothetical protein